ncbi:MAG: PqqD family peptide modification chaperone [Candidatus Nanopelagicales bacterium]
MSEPVADPGEASLTVPGNVLVEFYEDSAVLLDTVSLEYVELDDTAATMWRALTLTRTVDEAVDQLASIYDAPRGLLAADFGRLTTWLLDAGYLQSAPDDDHPAEPELADLGALRKAEPPGGHTADQMLRDSYVELLMRSLCGLTQAPADSGAWGDAVPGAAARVEHLGHRARGADLPPHAMTMIGLHRMRNIRDLVTSVIQEGVPGDLMECGVWRGGATIFMRGLLRAYQVDDRRVWAADSFQGLPTAKTAQFPLDAEWEPAAGRLAVPLEAVRRNFAAFDLLDDQVQFLPGWFSESLPAAPIEQLAVLRLDGDLQESTRDALVHLYDQVAPGGFVIIDDFVFESCRTAVLEFRTERGITDPIQHADWTGVWWRKTA